MTSAHATLALARAIEASAEPAEGGGAMRALLRAQWSRQARTLAARCQRIAHARSVAIKHGPGARDAMRTALVSATARALENTLKAGAAGQVRVQKPHNAVSTALVHALGPLDDALDALSALATMVEHWNDAEALNGLRCTPDKARTLAREGPERWPARADTPEWAARGAIGTTFAIDGRTCALGHWRGAIARAAAPALKPCDDEARAALEGWPLDACTPPIAAALLHLRADRSPPPGDGAWAQATRYERLAADTCAIGKSHTAHDAIGRTIANAGEDWGTICTTIIDVEAARAIAQILTGAGQRDATPGRGTGVLSDACAEWGATPPPGAGRLTVRERGDATPTPAWETPCESAGATIAGADLGGVKGTTGAIAQIGETAAWTDTLMIDIVCTGQRAAALTRRRAPDEGRRTRATAAFTKALERALQRP